MGKRAQNNVTEPEIASKKPKFGHEELTVDDFGLTTTLKEANLLKETNNNRNKEY